MARPKKESALSQSAAEAAAKEFNKRLGLDDATTETSTAAPRKVKINLTLNQDTKEKLTSYAKAKGVSVSNLVAMWTDEHCV